MTDLARYQDPMTIQRVLNSAKTIAIVGLSNNELRASYFVGYYLRRHGYRVIPVNPRETEILGQKCYPGLLDVPEPVDIVNVFRAPDAVPGIARDAVAIKAGALWCQFGVINEEGAQIAEDGGLAVIMDRCIKVEHARYVGRMHWLGFNTERITSVRTGLQQAVPEYTPDGRYLVVDGRRWRATDPLIPEERAAQLRSALMAWRRAIKTARGTDAEPAARAGVQAAKVALGERGSPWWEQTPAERKARWEAEVPLP